MIIGLGQCIPDEGGQWVDVATGELCQPSGGKAAGRDDGVLQEINRMLQDIMKTVSGSKPPAHTTVPQQGQRPVVVADRPVQRQPAVGTVQRPSDLIPGVPNFLLFGGVAFFGVVMIAMMWQRR